MLTEQCRGITPSRLSRPGLLYDQPPGQRHRASKVPCAIHLPVQELELNDDKLSCLVSVVKKIHTRSTQDRLPVDKSFTLFKDTLLRHSVQRPPAGVGVFTQSEFKRILEWGLDTYYRHYKLYQYAFTDRWVCWCTPTTTWMVLRAHVLGCA